MFPWTPTNIWCYKAPMVGGKSLKRKLLSVSMLQHSRLNQRKNETGKLQSEEEIYLNRCCHYGEHKILDEKLSIDAGSTLWPFAKSGRSTWIKWKSIIRTWNNKQNIKSTLGLLDMILQDRNTVGSCIKGISALFKLMSLEYISMQNLLTR